MALRIQNCWRSKASRDAVKSKREDMEKMVLMQKGALRIQTQIRAFLARARVRTILEGETRELVLGSHATFIPPTPTVIGESAYLRLNTAAWHSGPGPCHTPYGTFSSSGPPPIPCRLTS